MKVKNEFCIACSRERVLATLVNDAKYLYSYIKY